MKAVPIVRHSHQGSSCLKVFPEPGMAYVFCEPLKKPMLEAALGISRCQTTQFIKHTGSKSSINEVICESSHIGWTGGIYSIGSEMAAESVSGMNGSRFLADINSGRFAWPPSLLPPFLGLPNALMSPL